MSVANTCGPDLRIGSVRPGCQESTVRRLATAFLALEGVAGLSWWSVLVVWPETRTAFTAAQAPESTLLAFSGADLLLYVGGALAAARGMARRAPWTWPVLCIHTGAASYAALYGIGLLCFDSRVWLPAALMSPALCVLPLLVWHVRPGGSLSCSPT